MESTPLTRVTGFQWASVSYAGAHTARSGLLPSCRSPVPNEVLSREYSDCEPVWLERGPPVRVSGLHLVCVRAGNISMCFNVLPLTRIGTPLLLTRDGSMGSRKALSVTDADHTQFAVRYDLAVLTQLFVFLCPCCWFVFSSPGSHRHFKTPFLISLPEFAHHLTSFLFVALLQVCVFQFAVATVKLAV